MAKAAGHVNTAGKVKAVTFFKLLPQGLKTNMKRKFNNFQSDLPSSDSLKKSSQDYKVRDDKDEEKVDIDLSKTKFTGLEQGSLEVICKVFFAKIDELQEDLKNQIHQIQGRIKQIENQISGLTNKIQSMQQKKKNQKKKVEKNKKTKSRSKKEVEENEETDDEEEEEHYALDSDNEEERKQPTKRKVTTSRRGNKK